MKHIDLFSGIGGFALAVDRVWPDTEHIFCDNEPFAQEIIKKHWPEASLFGDIRALTNPEYHGVSGAEDVGFDNENKQEVSSRSLLPVNESQRSSSVWASGFRGQPDILTGGFPCQPFSQAGRRKGTDDNRYLWPEMFRVIREFKPRWVVAENVAGLLTIQQGVVFEQVCTDLEEEGYEVQPFIIPACSVNAPHRRDRVWIVAHRRQQYGEERRDEEMGTSAPEWASRIADTQRRSEDVANSNDSGLEGGLGEELSRSSERPSEHSRRDWRKNWIEVATALCRVDDGLPRRVDRAPRLKALGNAIVPQVAEEIFRAIKDVEQYNK